MKRVKCESGTIGWQDKLQNVYTNLDEFRSFCEVFALYKRLGFYSAKDAWEANPTIQGSTNPDDFRVVKPIPTYQFFTETYEGIKTILETKQCKKPDRTKIYKELSLKLRDESIRIVGYEIIEN